MALNNFHRVLISVAALFFFCFGLYTFRGGFPVALGIGSLVVAAGGVAYLIYFNRKVRMLQSTEAHGPAEPRI